jgi:hypothetical protein
MVIDFEDLRAEGTCRFEALPVADLVDSDMAVRQSTQFRVATPKVSDEAGRGVVHSPTSTQRSLRRSVVARVRDLNASSHPCRESCRTGVVLRGVAWVDGHDGGEDVGHGGGAVAVGVGGPADFE